MRRLRRALLWALVVTAVVLAVIIVGNHLGESMAPPSVDAPDPTPTTVPSPLEERADRQRAEAATARLEAAVTMDVYREATEPKASAEPLR